MKLEIDIKTPAGQSLGGFPLETSTDIEPIKFDGEWCKVYRSNGVLVSNTHLHSEDIITIKIK